MYEGRTDPDPRVGEAFQHEGDAKPVESVTWDIQSGDLVVVTLVARRSAVHLLNVPFRSECLGTDLSQRVRDAVVE